MVIVRIAIFIASVLALLAYNVPIAGADAPLVVAKYYAWFDQNSWDPARLSDMPVARYISADRPTMERQVREAKSAGIDVFSLNWYGPNNPTDSNLQTLLSVAAANNFTVSADMDMTSPLINNPGDVVNCLNYLKRYFSDGSWLRYSGKPVFFFYATRKYDVETWANIRSLVDPAREAVWIGEGDIFTYLRVFDGIYPYSVAWASDPGAQNIKFSRWAAAYPGKLWIATVMPGYDDTGVIGRSGTFARARDDGAYYRKAWEGAIASEPVMVSITSWNEWIEGSQIEPSVSYADLYLRITREYSDRYKSTSSASYAMNIGGDFYAQAGQGKGGYWITDEDGMGFWSSFQDLGAVDALGYPSSSRFEMSDGFNYQATQGALLQWRPEQGRAVLANTFQMLEAAGKDGWLDAVKGIPLPIKNDGSGGNWQRAKDTRMGWLTNDAIRNKFLSAGSVDRAIELYGLPMSKPEKRGPFIVQRFQRIAFQLWTDAVAGMPSPGTVVRVLGGDMLKEAGLIPAKAATPVLQ